MKIKRPKTRLWHVYLQWDGAVVSARRLGISCIEYRRVRACTAKAAGRRIVRKNLAVAMAGAEHETNNPSSPTYHDFKEDMIRESERRAARIGTVRVVK